MALINECKNVEAQKLLEPYLSGMEVGYINRLFERLEKYTYEQLVEHATLYRDTRLFTILDMVGNQLEPLMKKG